MTGEKRRASLSFQVNLGCQFSYQRPFRQMRTRPCWTEKSSCWTEVHHRMVTQVVQKGSKMNLPMNRRPLYDDAPCMCSKLCVRCYSIPPQQRPLFDHFKTRLQQRCPALGRRPSTLSSNEAVGKLATLLKTNMDPDNGTERLFSTGYKYIYIYS